jgi:predicted metal-dependent hydrolase
MLKNIIFMELNQPDTTKKTIRLAGKRVEYRERVSVRARGIRMTIEFGKGLTVIHPIWQSANEIADFLQQKSRWILKHLLALKKIEAKTILPHSRDTYHAGKAAAKILIENKVTFFNSLYRYPYRTIRIGNQTSLWGSCSRSNTLKFNFKLTYLPQPLIDYVVVHELCHVEEHNHSRAFWALVSRAIPDYKARRRQLSQYIIRKI